MSLPKGPNNRTDPFNSKELRAGLGGKTVRGGIFVTTSTAIQTAIQLASIPILARLLSPDEFGLVAMVAVIINLSTALAEGGLSTATIQSKELNHAQASNLFWLSSALGVGFCCLISLCSPLIAAFYSEPRLTPIAIAYSTIFLFTGLAIQHQALLRRSMRFDILALTQVVSTVVSQAVAIAWAWSRQGEPEAYYALVLAPIALHATRLILLVLLGGWRPSLPQRHSDTKRIAFFGAGLTGVRIISQLSLSADAIALGRFVGPQPLGLYDRANHLMMTPIRQLSPPLIALALPALSRLRGEDDRYLLVYKACLSIVLLGVTPIAAMTFAAPAICIESLFGSEWLEMKSILQTLSLGMLFAPILNSASWIYKVEARLRELMWLNLTDAVIRCLAISLAAYTAGVMGVAIVAILRPLVMIFPFFIVLGRQSPICLSIVASLVLQAVTAWLAASLAVYSLAPVVELAPLLVQVAILASTSILISFATFACYPAFRKQAATAMDLYRSRKG